MTDLAVHIVLAVVAGVASIVAAHLMMLLVEERSKRERLSEKYETLRWTLDWLGQQAPEERHRLARRLSRGLQLKA